MLLTSAGIGATPVLAMLQALAEEHSDREIWWLHGARNRREHSFAAEARSLLASLSNVHTHVYYSRPDPNDLEGRDCESAGRLTGSLLAEFEPPPRCPGIPVRTYTVHGRDQRRSGGDGDRRLTHPHRTVRTRAGPDARHRSNTCADAPPTRRPTWKRRNHQFARSNLAIPWSSDYSSLLELAEAGDVPVRWSCRTGVCHTCETTLIAGELDYNPDPVEPPADGSALICCSQPHGDIVLDL